MHGANELDSRFFRFQNCLLKVHVSNWICVPPLNHISPPVRLKFKVPLGSIVKVTLRFGVGLTVGKHSLLVHRPHVFVSCISHGIFTFLLGSASSQVRLSALHFCDFPPLSRFSLVYRNEAYSDAFCSIKTLDVGCYIVSRLTYPKHPSLILLACFVHSSSVLRNNPLPRFPLSWDREQCLLNTNLTFSVVRLFL